MEIKGKYNSAKVMIDDIDSTTYSQIQFFVNHPEFKSNIAIMPDTHAGKGSVIGFTMPVGERICPNIIGVDIGCGMLAINIGSRLKQELQYIDKTIRRMIPLGFNVHNDSGDYSEYKDLSEKVNTNYTRVCNSVGTLGGGNHFIEIGIDDEKNYWLVVHTGSRNLGKQVCDYWQKKAIEKTEAIRKEEIKNILKKTSDVDKQNALNELKTRTPFTRELAFLDEDDSKLYLKDMKKAQQYAVLNREEIVKLILKKLEYGSQENIESIHNFINFEDNIIRKGAISSYSDEKMIIPFNMRDGILICKGKSNSDWNYSAPHGAGRVLSRGDAKRKLSIDEFKNQMKDVYSSSVNINTLDEAPNAYKDSKIIEDAIEPTAEIINRIKPVLNIKC